MWGTDVVKHGMQEALEIAEVALGVMNDHADDEKVQSMARCILGEDKFQQNFDSVKGMLHSCDQSQQRSPEPHSRRNTPESRSILERAFWRRQSPRRVVVVGEKQ
jgi:hypothetical protein